MTPRRPLHHALSLVVGGVAAMALVGCGNGMQVAGPEKPHVSVLSGRATPSAKASAKPADTPSPDASTSQSAGDGSTDGSGNDAGGADGSGQDDGGSNGTNGSGDSGKDGTGSKGSNGSGTKDSGSGKKNSDDKSGKKSGGTGSDDKSGDKPKSDPDPTNKPSKAKATCTIDDLSVAVRVPAGSGAAGSNYVLITFTNTSGEACWMFGYAGVSFVGNKNGTQLGKPAVRDKSANAERVKLADGRVQTELLRISSAGNYDATDCVPTTADGFRIYPPGSFKSAYVEFATDACQSKSVRQLTVYPVGTKS